MRRLAALIIGVATAQPVQNYYGNADPHVDAACLRSCKFAIFREPARATPGFHLTAERVSLLWCSTRLQISTASTRDCQERPRHELSRVSGADSDLVLSGSFASPIETPNAYSLSVLRCRRPAVPGSGRDSTGTHVPADVQAVAARRRRRRLC